MEETIYQDVQNLLAYGVKENLLDSEDVLYSRNRILALLSIEDWVDCEEVGSFNLEETLNRILDWANRKGIIKSNTITERDILDTEIMNCLMPRPSSVIRAFYEKNTNSCEEATNYFYQLSKASNYIRTGRIAKNKQWKSATPYGEMDITINLSKPEKDPKEIALLKNMPHSSYPTCALCIENVGYKGNMRNAARATHRAIPITINAEDWFLQYSPYVYYNEHSIIFRKEHVPMKISRESFNRLLDFTQNFPHYFIGSNADLPIVGGSILSHDHFQGGRYQFAIERAEIEESYKLAGFPSVSIGVVNWPMSVLRVCGTKEEVADVTEFIWKTWLDYTDESAQIRAYSGSTPHNTITPIARRRGDLYEMDVVLRNNRTTEEFPDGIFHPHKELHHIKKENIGLIEVMGLAILPGRLDDELEKLARYLLHSTPKEEWDATVVKHWDWFQELSIKYHDVNVDNVMDILQVEVGNKFKVVLEHAGVFKKTATGRTAFTAFIHHLQNKSDQLFNK